MAVSANLLTPAAGTSSATTTFTTASITPTANRLIGVWVLTDGGTPNTITGCGLTWVQEVLNTALVPVAFFRSMGASPSSGTLAIALGANTVGSWVIVEYDEVDTSGSNGAGAIRASQDTSNTGNGTSFGLTLPAAVNAGNAVAGMWIIGGTGASLTPGGSYSKLGETTASGFADHAHQWNATGTQNPSMSWTGTQNVAAIAVELVAAGAAATDVSYRPDALSVVRYSIPALGALRGGDTPTVVSADATIDAECATATAAAQDAGVSAAPVSEAATATAAAQDPAPSVAPVSEAATATAAGQDATGTTILIGAEAATASAAAQDATVSSGVLVPAEVAQAAATAQDAGVSASPVAEAALATAAASDATVLTGAVIQAEAALATAAAQDAGTKVAPVVEAATATAAAQDATAATAVTALAQAATATAAAQDATSRILAGIEAATATALGQDAAITLDLIIVWASGAVALTSDSGTVVPSSATGAATHQAASSGQGQVK